MSPFEFIHTSLTINRYFDKFPEGKEDYKDWFGDTKEFEQVEKAFQAIKRENIFHEAVYSNRCYGNVDVYILVPDTK